MSKKPTVAVRRMDDVHIAPDERPAWRCEVSLGIRAPFMLVRVRVIVFFAGAGARRERRQGKRE